jgi:hypothetical protein
MPKWGIAGVCRPRTFRTATRLLAAASAVAAPDQIYQFLSPADTGGGDSEDPLITTPDRWPLPPDAFYVSDSDLEALCEEYVERLDVPSHLKLTGLVFGDVERWAEDFTLAADEVRRPFDSAGLTVPPLGEQGPVVVGTDSTHAVRLGNSGKHVGKGDVAAFLEERTRRARLTASPILSFRR